jgi:hypothetical protein
MGMEETDITDPSSGRNISVSTTARILYRKMNPEYEGLRNIRLNEIIANDFAKHSGRVLHYFRLGKADKTRSEQLDSSGGTKANVAEIRGSSSFYYISAIKDRSIEILTVQSSWLKPKYKGSSKSPMEFGDS